MASKEQKQRRQSILRAIDKLGGNPTVREVAKEADLHVNGASQTIGVMEEVEYTDTTPRNGGDWKVKIKS